MQSLRIIEIVPVPRLSAMDLLYSLKSELRDQSYSEQIRSIYFAMKFVKQPCAPYLGGMGHDTLLVYFDAPDAQFKWLAENKIQLNPEYPDLPIRILAEQIRDFQPQVVITELSLGLSKEFFSRYLDCPALICGRGGNSNVEQIPEYAKDAFDLILNDCGIVADHGLLECTSEILDFITGDVLFEHEVRTLSIALADAYSRVDPDGLCGAGKDYMQKISNAISLINQRNFSTALEILRNLCQKYSHIRALFYYGVCLKLSGKRKEGCELIMESGAFAEDAPEISLFACQELLNENQPEAALEIIENFLLKNPFVEQAIKLYDQCAQMYSK